jgi:hypothetical protein
MRKNERFTRQQVASLCGSFDAGSTGKLLEVARRQGLITSSFQDGPEGQKTRLYHSWDYTPQEFDFAPAEKKEEAIDYDEFF